MDSLSEFIDFDIYECEDEQRGAESRKSQRRMMWMERMRL